MAFLVNGTFDIYGSQWSCMLLFMISVLVTNAHLLFSEIISFVLFPLPLWIQNYFSLPQCLQPQSLQIPEILKGNMEVQGLPVLTPLKLRSKLVRIISQLLNSESPPFSLSLLSSISSSAPHFSSYLLPILFLHPSTCLPFSSLPHCFTPAPHNLLLFLGFDQNVILNAANKVLKVGCNMILILQ